MVLCLLAVAVFTSSMSVNPEASLKAMLQQASAQTQAAQMPANAQVAPETIVKFEDPAGGGTIVGQFMKIEPARAEAEPEETPRSISLAR